MSDPTPLWDSDDPSGSEQRLREAAAMAEGRDQLVLMTQVARAMGVQEKYDDAHAVLDNMATHDPEVATRISLERGRLLHSAGRPDEARPHVEAGAASARSAGLDALLVESLELVALVTPAQE